MTGGGTGIGRGVALALARRGVTVLLAGRRQVPLATTAAEVQALGADAIVLPIDLTNPAERQTLVDAVHTQVGPIDTLINNAGLLSNGGLAAQSAASVMATVMTNLVAPIELTRLFLPDLTAQQGRVVLIGSTTSFVPLPYLSLYSATKAGLQHFGAALRHELTPLGVQVLQAFPPATATAMTAAMAGQAAQTTWGKFARLATPEQIGERIVQALADGKEECVWWRSEHLLRLFYRLAPRLTARILFTQRHLLAQSMGVVLPTAAPLVMQRKRDMDE